MAAFIVSCVALSDKIMQDSRNKTICFGSDTDREGRLQLSPITASCREGTFANFVAWVSAPVTCHQRYNRYSKKARIMRRSTFQKVHQKCATSSTRHQRRW